MLKINVHLILRLAIGTVTAIAFALAPQLAHAQAPGALAQLASPNNCIQVTNGGSPDCETTGPGLLGSEDVAVSPDGKNVYVVGNGDDAISEFTRDDHGVLTWEGCIADANDTDPTSCSDNKTAAGLINPDAIAISPDGNNVYVTGVRQRRKRRCRRIRARPPEGCSSSCPRTTASPREATHPQIAMTTTPSMPWA